MFQKSKIMQDDTNYAVEEYMAAQDAKRFAENNAAEQARKAAEEAARIKAANDAKYGSGMTLASVQDLFTNRQNQGIQFQKSAADIARDLINGVTPTTAMLSVNNNSNSSVQSAGTLMNNSAQPNDALAYRNAQIAVNNQQAQNLKNASLARSQEIANARNVIAGTGANMQGLGLTNYGNNLKVVGGLQQQADSGQTAADMANNQKRAQEQASGLGALSAGLAAFSDINTKENITKLYTFNNGLSIYEYNYKPEYLLYTLAKSGKNYGFMAQEVENVYPTCVFNTNNIKTINYSKLLANW
jgi:hypothetical protein